MRRPVALVLALALCAAPAASAQDDGVVVDPDSPTGKEYKLPLDSARRQAGTTKSTGKKPAPLFGEGIQSEGGDDDAAAAPGGGSKGGTDSGGTGTGGSGSGSAAPPPPPASAEAQDALERAALQPGAPDDGGSALLILGIAAAVLLVGGLAGYGLRARTPSPS